MPDHLPNWSKEFGYGKFIHLDHHRSGFARMMQGDQFFREIESNCWDPILRIDEYAKYDTQVQVVCTIPVLFSYWAKPEDGLKVSQFLPVSKGQLPLVLKQQNQSKRLVVPT